MNMIDLQRFLFDPPPARLDLVNYTSSVSYVQYTVYVCRNHAFEPVEKTMKAYLDYAQMAIHFQYSDYDDSLSFMNVNTSADMLLLWIDFSRYAIENIVDFVKQRIAYLRTIFKKNILIAPLCAEDFTCSEAGVYVLDMHSIKNSLSESYLDLRLEVFSGTKLGKVSLLELSKKLALQYFFALLRQPIKAVIVDLDNTLYDGVLGEDGIGGIVLTEKHRELQRFLVDLSKKGVFICAVSKNNSEDVERLFVQRTDFPLKWQDFTKVCVSWDLKSESIKKITHFLNIHEDSVVFVDDNIGEIIEVSVRLPEIKIIYASNVDITKKVLENFPGLFRIFSVSEDTIRKEDVQANEERSRLKEVLSTHEYIKSLRMILTYKINNERDIQRIVELANKTNQFILSYKRYTTTDIIEYMRNDESVVVSIFLQDRLSNSGLIGACVLIKNEKIAILDELFISCRALGRGIDGIMVLNALKIALKVLKIDRLKVNFQHGERNAPAEIFTNTNLSAYRDEASLFNYPDTQDIVEIQIER